MSFAYLHTHSHYSLLEAVPKIPDLVARVKAQGHTALALTDFNNLYAAVEFYKECTHAGIKPIIGVDLSIAPRTRNDKDYGVDTETDRLVLLAETDAGYRSLVRLVSRAHTEGFLLTARADDELLAEYREGVCAIIPTYTRSLDAGSDVGRAQRYVERIRSIFGENTYLEYAYHPKTYGNDARRESIERLSVATGVPLVASREVYYLDDDDRITKELVVHIQRSTTLTQDDEERSADFSLLPDGEETTAFAHAPHALANCEAIVNRCSVTLVLGRWVFPNYPLLPGKTYDEMLRDFAYTEALKKSIDLSGATKERVDYELSVIQKKGYSPYFLVVADLMRHAREANIYTNTRGSAAGSFVSYVVGITTVNPLEYNLPFERFLNPERPSAPDIDMDVADNKRDALIDYARSKYGDDHVAQIGTFGTMAARAAVRDVARALGYSYSVGDRIAKLIPVGAQGFQVTIAKALETEKELAELHKKDPVVRQVLTYAQRIEGNARHVGVHAAGVVMSPTDVTDFTPIQLDPKGGKTITQYDMYSVEEAGLLKFDFLGLKNLAVLADAVARVKKIQNIDVPIYTLPLDDAKTFRMLSKGRTMGVFQFASDGMTRYLTELEPTSVYDLNAMVALYRPGPMEFIPEYIARKRDPRKVVYIDPRLESILNKSYGIITYQDDVLMIAINIAGYSWLEADKFRKAMGKKIPEEMASQKEKFMKGCRASGTKEDVVQELWKQIETFAAYGFNKSHAASYGNLAYKTAYMKANFPCEYMAALMTADSGDVETIAEMVNECNAMKIKVLPPDINESFGVFSVDTRTTIEETADNGSVRTIDAPPHKRNIRFGLTSIKNFGEGLAESIVAERKKGGPFASLADFFTRIGDRNLNKKSLESLIKSGSLDRFGRRSTLLHNLDAMLAFHKEVHKEAAQDSLFGGFGTAHLTLVEPTERTPKAQFLAWEKELLGLYVSGHPLDAFKHILADKATVHQVVHVLPPGVSQVLGVHVDEVRTLLTKKGDKMAFVKISDFSGQTEAVFFPEAFAKSKDVLVVGGTVLVKGKVSNRNGEKSFMADAAKKMQ